MKHTAKNYSLVKSLKTKLNIKDMNLPARSSAFFTLTNLLCKGAAFLFTPIFTRLLTPEDYGEYSLFSTLLSLSVIMATMEISGGIIMRLFQKEKNYHFLSILAAWSISVIAAAPITLILFFIHKFGGFGMSFPLAYTFLFIAIISISLINLFVSRCKFIYSWVPPLITSLMQSVTAPLISIALLRISYLSSANHVSVKIGAVTLILAITAICLICTSVKRAKSEIKNNNLDLNQTYADTKKSIRFLLKLALPLFPYYLSIMAISQADKLFISGMLGKAELAKYSVAYSAGVALSAVTNGVMGSLSPWIMRKTRAGEYDRIRRVLNRITTVSIPIIIIFLCFAPEFFSFLAPPEYKTALPVLFISSIIPVPLALAQCSSSIAIAKERVGGVLFSGIFPAVFTISLDFLIIKNAPIYAAAMITAFGFLLLAAIGIANVRKIIGEFAINVNKTFQNLLLLLLSAAAIFMFKDFIYVRISIVILALISIVFMAKKTISILKESKA